MAATSLYGTFNDYMRAAMKRHKRLRATCIVDPGISVYELERMRDDGFVGIRLVFSKRENIPDLNSDDYRRLLRRVADLDSCVHFTERHDRVPAMIEVLERNGIRKIALDHFGMLDNPEGLDSETFNAIARALERGKTWVKISAGYRFPAGAREARGRTRPTDRRRTIDVRQRLAVFKVRGQGEVCRHPRLFQVGDSGRGRSQEGRRRKPRSNSISREPTLAADPHRFRVRSDSAGAWRPSNRKAARPVYDGRSAGLTWIRSA